MSRQKKTFVFENEKLNHGNHLRFCPSHSPNWLMTSIVLGRVINVARLVVVIRLKLQVIVNQVIHVDV